MPSNQPLTLPFSLLILLLCSSAAASNSFVYSGCSPSKSDPTTPFQSNLNGLLSSFATSAAQTSYNAFAAGNSSSSPPGSAAFGLYQCRTDVDLADCSACVASAVAQLPLVCPAALAASLQLDSCLIRYSSDDFLGRPDTSLAYRKCGPATSDAADAEFLRRRDDVIGGMTSSGPAGFRSGRSGTVQGYAQCLGDLGPGDCSACLGQALGQLGTACGSALAADVFLAQCYAQFWASGYYVRSSDYTDDNVGRNVAIIIGVVAGLAIFVLFVSYLKSAC